MSHNWLKFWNANFLLDKGDTRQCVNSIFMNYLLSIYYFRNTKV